MNVAFYAPLKPPGHPTPSGDRGMARSLIAALRHGGCEVTLASSLRSREATGDAAHQNALCAAAEVEIARIVTEKDAADWNVWITYHNYYKAPDLIGPKVAEALNLPYMLIEATRARKRLAGPWARFAAAAEAATDAAHTVFYFTHHDALTLRRDAPAGQRLLHLPPFLPQDTLPPITTRAGPMLSVGMMRPGDKIASYTLIAEALAVLPRDVEWSLKIAGDGAAAADVHALFAQFGARITWLGKLEHDALSVHYAQASLLLWPGVNEAFGLTYLEAQAAGLPVVAQDRPGVRDVVFGPMAAVETGAAGLAERIRALLGNEARRAAEGTAARDRIARAHLLPAASRTLLTAIEDAL